MENLNIQQEQEFKITEEAAKAGNALAQKRLAEMYEKGIGTKKDLERAKYWDDKAKGMQV